MLRYNNGTAPVALFMNGWADSPKRGKQNKQMIYYTTNQHQCWRMESHRLYNDEGATDRVDCLRHLNRYYFTLIYFATPVINTKTYFEGKYLKSFYKQYSTLF